MSRVAVTGGSGKLGRAVIADLIAHGWTVHNFDLAPPQERICSFTRLDLTDLGQVIEALHGIDELHTGVDAVVHLGAIPGATHAANTRTFINNVSASYNVFTAAQIVGVNNIVWASSETLLGYPFATPPPYVPMDEEYPAQPNVAYSLAKDVEEELARQFCRWHPQLKMIGLRISNVMEPAEYADFPSFDPDPTQRRWNLWGYVDARDAAQAVRLALDLPTTGFEAFNIAAADTVMSRSTSELMATYFPDVPVRQELATHQSLTSCEKARRVLGFEPQYHWRDV